MKSSLFITVVIPIFISCVPPSEKNRMQDLGQRIKYETEKWKKELLLNGDVGTPCEEDQMRWNAKNPEVFYGLPDSINSKVFDVNSDKINDILLYFPAGDCCRCSMGLNESSDFVKLIYSDGTEFLSNDHLREKIALKIEGEYHTQTDTVVERTIFSITNFDTEISGTFKVWTPEDPDCCASVEGTFKYNPFTWMIKLEKHVVQ